MTVLVRTSGPAAGAVDPVAFGGAAAVLLTVVPLANLVPPLRAARVDSVDALRHE